MRNAKLKIICILFLLAACQPTAPAIKPEVQKVKLCTEKAGIYRLSLDDLKKTGLDSAHPDRLRLSLRGKPYPFWIENDNLYFAANASQSLYSRQNFFWLEKAPADAPGKPGGAFDVVPPADAGSAPSSTVLFTLQMEENLFYDPQSPRPDGWMWQRTASPGTMKISFSTQDLREGPRAELLLYVWGSGGEQHRLSVRINNQPVTEFSWAGSSMQSLTASFSPALLKDGENRLELSVPDSPQSLDMANLDRLTLTYPRAAQAYQGELTFTSGGTPEQLSGFSAKTLFWNLADPGSLTRIQPDAGNNLILAGAAGASYQAVDSQAWLRPGCVTPETQVPDLLANKGMDYLVIAPEEYLPALQPLLDWRSSQGRQVNFVSFENVADTFGYGYPVPEAIRTYLQTLTAQGSSRLRSVLLAGDASYAEANDQLPTFYLRTQYGGWTASDWLYAAPAGDEAAWKPSFAVGRLPARNSDQVSRYVQKIISAEKQEPGSAPGRVALFSDPADPRFSEDAARFAGLIPENISVTRSQQSALPAFEQGTRVIAYFGHGSLTAWGQAALLTSTQAATLQNREQVPLVLNFTCLTGFFIHPEQDSLAETLLWSAGGATSVLAPSSLTLPADQSFLAEAVAKALYGTAQTTGEAVLSAWKSAPDDPAVREVLQTFLIFGDPAARLSH